MIDQIKNKVLNNVKSASVDAQSNKKVGKTNTVLQQTSTEPKTSEAEKNISKFVSKETIKDMSNEPPVDKINVSRIKNAIASGSYPVDLEKISDALFTAYKEMKN